MKQIDFSCTMDLNTLKDTSDRYDRLIHIKESLDNIYNLDCFAHLIKGSDYLICALPSAQSSKSPIQNPVFHRWSWYKYFSSTSYICLSDPALYKAAIPGTWFMNDGSMDIIEEIARFIIELTKILDIGLDKVLFYGSSMGGFGGLMLATYLKESYAIAEVPQIDMRLYPFKSAIAQIEDKILMNKSFEEFSESYSERVNVMSRIEKSNIVPSFKIITNDKDHAYGEHISFFTKVNSLRAEKKMVGDCSIYVSSDSLGHRPLPSSKGVSLIKSAIYEGWNTITTSPEE